MSDLRQGKDYLLYEFHSLDIETCRIEGQQFHEVTKDSLKQWMIHVYSCTASDLRQLDKSGILLRQRKAPQILLDRNIEKVHKCALLFQTMKYLIIRAMINETVKVQEWTELEETEMQRQTLFDEPGHKTFAVLLNEARHSLRLKNPAGFENIDINIKQANKQ